MSFQDRLIGLIHRVATGGWRMRLVLTPVGILLFLGVVVGLVLLSVWCDRLFRLPPPLHSPFNVGISIPLVSVGLALILWSNIHFARAAGTPVPLNPPRRLVTNGPYAITRNPMLTGLFILLLGLGVLMKSLALIVVFTPALILASFLELKYIEELELEKRLGQPYLEYTRRVPMFLPRIGKPDRGVDSGIPD